MCTTWGLKAGNIYLLDVFRGKLEMPELCRKVIELSDRYNPERVLIEDKGSGTALMQALRAQYFHKATPYLPKGDKMTRFARVSPTIEGGVVHLPERADWLDDFLHELCGFPATKHDDQIDSVSQALQWIRENLSHCGLIEFYRRENEERRAARGGSDGQVAGAGRRQSRNRYGRKLDYCRSRPMCLGHAR